MSGIRSCCLLIFAFLLCVVSGPPAIAGVALLGDIAAVRSGEIFSCALTVNQTVQCWGSNQEGELGDGSGGSRSLPGPVPMFGGLVTDLAVGDFHACANQTGAVSCWGYGGNGQLGVGNSKNSITPQGVALPGPAASLALGNAHSCALLSDGRIYCWGSNAHSSCKPACLKTNTTASAQTYGAPASSPDAYIGYLPTQLTLPAAFLPVSITAGADHDCAISIDGRAICWGSNLQGQLGPTPPSDNYTAVEVPGISGQNPSALSAGGQHTCAIVKGGEVRCWGSNWVGQLGDGTDVSTSTPVKVALPAAEVATHITSGYAHTCALTSTKKLFCWGANDYGQGGNDNAAFVRVPTEVVGLPQGVIVDIDAGYVHTCVTYASGNAACWGAAHFGQLGASGPSTSVVPSPVRVTSLQPGELLSTGTGHACATDTGGSLLCWGSNYSGQLGQGNDKSHSEPVLVPGLTNLTSVATGWQHTCASDGTGVWCWGRGVEGQLGNGGYDGAASPDQIPSFPPAGKAVMQLSGAEEFTCARLSDDSVWCWGINSYGAASDGNDPSVPHPIAGLPIAGKHIVDLVSGATSSCVTFEDGSARCWGSINTQFNMPLSAPISGLGPVTKMSTGDRSACSIGMGVPHCWGAESYGSLGNGGADASTDTPAAVAFPAMLPGVHPVAVTSSEWHSCAAYNNGEAWCWGENSTGQLGNGLVDFYGEAKPVRVQGLSGVVNISTSSGYTCARDGASLACWGEGFLGQLGDGSAYRSKAIFVRNGDGVFSGDFE